MVELSGRGRHLGGDDLRSGTRSAVFGVDGPSPWNASKRRGDNLFTESVVAVNADTGEYIWHYQTLPNDTWDLNDCSPIVIGGLTIEGKRTRVLMHAPKNGFFYILEAKNGRLLAADKIGHPTWASRIDLTTGRPVENRRPGITRPTRSARWSIPVRSESITGMP